MQRPSSDTTVRGFLSPILQEGLVKLADDTTNPSYGFPPENRPIQEHLRHGLISLDKPSGPTSHEVVAWVKRLLKVEKAGHSGTLDPLVTGLLPVGLGEATKALSVLLLRPKEYVAVCRLHDPVDQEKLRRVFGEFRGAIYQRPPERSSVKKVTRIRHIYDLEILEEQGRLLLVRVRCEAGTYVRKLIYDIGEVLGPGATMVELRRTSVCHIFEDEGLVRFHDLAYAKHLLDTKGEENLLRSMIKPVEYATVFLKTLVIRDSAVDAICHGAQLAVPGIVTISPDIAKDEQVAIYTLKGELVSLGEAKMSSAEIQSAEKGIAASSSRVIMKTGVYPKMWRTKSSTSEGKVEAGTDAKSPNAA